MRRRASPKTLTGLREFVLDHNELLAVDINWSGGLLIAAKPQ
jgi:hypothetical protein